VTACGHLQPFDLLEFKKFEQPLSEKVDIQHFAQKFSLLNGRFAAGSGHWANIDRKVR
jgi:hypothetical protein